MTLATLLGLLKPLLAIAQYLIQYMHDKQLLDAGAAQEALRNLQGTQDAIFRAKRAVDAVDDSPDSVRNDPDNIDNRKPALSGGSNNPVLGNVGPTGDSTLNPPS